MLILLGDSVLYYRRYPTDRAGIEACPAPQSEQSAIQAFPHRDTTPIRIESTHPSTTKRACPEIHCATTRRFILSLRR